MTLKEKFDWYLSGGENCPEANECEKIANEFAIGFAEWIDVLVIEDNNKYCANTTKELLEIYKKEKNL